ncbi:MAG: hypothetical protein WD648_01840 [Planctomycetaceae bacterium]
MSLRVSSTLAIMLAYVGVSTSTANANPMRHIDEVALAMRSDAAMTLSEIRYHYRGSVEYQHLYNDAFEVYRLAGHVHELAHHADSIDHIRVDAVKLDELLHHLNDVICQVNPVQPGFGYGHAAAYDHGYGYGYGVPAVGYAYRSNRLNELVASMSESLNHLLTDIDGGPSPAVVPVAPVFPVVPAPSAGPVYRTPGSSARFEFGKGKNRFAITLGR